MAFRNPMRISNSSGAPIVVVIEPWANEWELASGEEAEVVAIHPSKFPRLSLDLLEGKAVFYVEDGGSLYEFWLAGVLVDGPQVTGNGRTPLPRIPG